MKTLQLTKEEEEMRTGTYNDCASYFSMGGSVSTEIIFPLLKPGSEIQRQSP